MSFYSRICIWVLGMITGLAVAGPASAQAISRTTLEVTNISCSSCLRVIESEFRKVPGIVGMASDLKRGIVVADHEKALSPGEVAAVVSRIGYPARVVSSVSVLKQHARVFRRLAGYGGGPQGCSPGGCSPVADSWKELYRRFVGSGKSKGSVNKMKTKRYMQNDRK